MTTFTVGTQGSLLIGFILVVLEMERVGG